MCVVSLLCFYAVSEIGRAAGRASPPAELGPAWLPGKHRKMHMNSPFSGPELAQKPPAYLRKSRWWGDRLDRLDGN